MQRGNSKLIRVSLYGQHSAEDMIRCRSDQISLSMATRLQLVARGTVIYCFTSLKVV